MSFSQSEMKSKGGKENFKTRQDLEDQEKNPEKSARRLVTYINQNPHITAKNLQEDFAGTGIVMLCSVVT